MKRYFRTAGITPDEGPNRDQTARKLRSESGFTLAETLLAVFIMLLVSVIVSTGMPAAMNAYRKVVLAANAKTMLSTAVTALHDEISTAWKVENSADNQSLTYFNASTGAKSMIAKYDHTKYSTESEPNPDLPSDSHKDAVTGSVWIWDYIPLVYDLIHDSDDEEGKGHEMISGAGFTPRMYVTYDTIVYNAGVVTISGLSVWNVDDDERPLAELLGATGAPRNLVIRVISADSVDSMEP